MIEVHQHSAPEASVGVACTEAPAEAFIQAHGASNALKAASSALADALASNDPPGALLLLDSLAKAALDGSKEPACADSLAEACVTCSAAVIQAQWGPTVGTAKPASNRHATSACTVL